MTRYRVEVLARCAGEKDQRWMVYRRGLELMAAKHECSFAMGERGPCITVSEVRIIEEVERLRKNENVRQDPDSGAWYAEVENYPDCQPHWVKVGGAHETERAAIVTLVAARFGDGDV